jgi:hypothetical protein
VRCALFRLRWDGYDPSAVCAIVTVPGSFARWPTRRPMVESRAGRSSFGACPCRTRRAGTTAAYGCSRSGTGYLGSVDLAEGRFEPVTFCPGYLRGLTFRRPFCRRRALQTTAQLDLPGPTARRESYQPAAEACCGVMVSRLRLLGGCVVRLGHRSGRRHGWDGIPGRMRRGRRLGCGKIGRGPRVPAGPGRSCCRAESPRHHAHPRSAGRSNSENARRTRTKAGLARSSSRLMSARAMFRSRTGSPC